MPLTKYNANLEKAGIQPIPHNLKECVVEKRYQRDIWELEKSLEILEPEWDLSATIECSGCDIYLQGCSEKALSRGNENFRINIARCLRTTCRKCEKDSLKRSSRLITLSWKV